ncbi:GGDEF domain-containing protein [Paenibacillus cremeus]|uniref:GGDEF domain-containing protein n=1 Tax=Paenibacillus cremeus TaxID=2163881 RepID=A0A559K837_9BACL|nr:GGDEF domain-containing protein [Paenibacillus cremeus]TVY08288.1 GGDEF domain-containing protein [Paenibacillus cremeus]
MNNVSFAELVFGPAGSVFMYSMLIVIIAMTMLVSLRLLMNRRKIGYFSMMVAFIILLVQYGQLIRLAINASETDASAYTALLLKVLAFVLFNIGIYQLYNVTRMRDFVVFGFFIAVSVLVSLTFWYIPDWLQGSEQQTTLLRPLFTELYLFLLLFLSFLLVNPRVGQNGKYQIMLTVYFTSHTLHMANVYLFGGRQPFLMLLEELIPFIFHIVLFLFIFERVIEVMQAIYHSSITDGLTKLFNRKYFYNRTSQFVANRVPVSVIFSDIDNFKKLNDTKGHHMGDQVLKQVAQIVKEETEDTGICGRYGGEEMVVLVTDRTVDAAELAERIRTRVEQESIVTVSMGYSHWKKGLSADELIKQADEAMYQAKTTGKNKVIGF